ncbi:MAG: hypothetical protein JSV88_11930 [Candidatus Aminicenantes bacterium]|nr:MAG: hypothetical protein JSV88_11930 [Candidatus Aminicenantes bacterium]
MTNVIIIEVKNRLEITRKCLEVYRHYSGITDTVYYNHSITLPLQTSARNRQEDYLEISTVEKSPGLTADCVIDLPAWANFDFLSGESVKIALTHLKERILLKITPGTFPWELKISMPTGAIVPKHDDVTIGDNPS